ncbi:MAG: PAP/fibrillin family protein [Cyanophyceae cyanobacterium]
MTEANQLKTELFYQIETLGPERSLLPFSEASIDDNIRRLENINPIPQPLRPSNSTALLGDWRLVYAANGTVVTRSMAEIANVFGSAIAVQIWQTLASQDRQITADNQALIELPLLGDYRLSAKGIWQPEPDERTAQVSFNTFSLQPTKFLGLPSSRLPALIIPILELFRNKALWITSYLDEDTRIGRGATGNMFVFKKNGDTQIMR